MQGGFQRHGTVQPILGLHLIIALVLQIRRSVEAILENAKEASTSTVEPEEVRTALARLIVEAPPDFIGFRAFDPGLDGAIQEHDARIA
jgi:hypothetical protein